MICDENRLDQIYKGILLIQTQAAKLRCAGAQFKPKGIYENLEVLWTCEIFFVVRNKSFVNGPGKGSQENVTSNSTSVDNTRSLNRYSIRQLLHRLMGLVFIFSSVSWVCPKKFTKAASFGCLICILLFPFTEWNRFRLALGAQAYYEQHLATWQLHTYTLTRPFLIL